MKFLLATIILASNLLGQQSDTIYQQILSAATSNGASSSVTAIGQSTHQVVVTLSSSGGTCTSTTVALVIEGSSDGSKYLQIGPMLVSSMGLTQTSTVESSARVNATGAYPFVRVNLLTGAGTNHCAVNAFYSGTVVPSYDSLNTSSADQHLSYFNGALNSSSFVSIISSTTGSNSKLVVYGLNLWNIAAQTVLLSCKSGISVVGRLTWTTLAANTNVNMPSGVRPIFSCPAGYDIVYLAAGGTEIDLAITYREE